MVNKEQLALLDTFETSKPSNPLFCHQEFLEKLAEHSRDAIGRRTSFLMQRLSVDLRRLHYKPTQGVNRGWRRSRLGGGHGSHFYAWWAPGGAQPLKESGEFANAPEGAVFLRDIRHHDDHSLLSAQSFDANYMPVTVRDLRREEYAPLPWTQSQVRFSAARQPVRLLKGHPGSGKTTALWNAADATGAERVLYVTYSRDLAALAREYFDKYCSSNKRFQVVTFPNLVRQALGLDTPIAEEQDARRRFGRDVAPFARSLGVWANTQTALYDELYAHLIGDALPVAIGRFTACTGPRVPDKAYRVRRTRSLGDAPSASLLDVAARLERIDERTLAERYFPELALAWRAVEKLRSFIGGGARPGLLDFDCIAVDECQDLTPIEALFIVELASLANGQRRWPVPLLMAGDEAQTVRPTDFEWGWLSDLLHTRLGSPAEYKLTANLRSPHRIAEMVNRVWDLYSHLQKQERPSGTGYAEIDDDATDQILYCTAVAGPELNELLLSLSTREGLALIALEDTVPAYVPEAARHSVLTVSEAKGLDFHSVCVLDAGRHLDRIVRDEGRLRADSDIEGLRKRLAIDQLRVAISRPTERLFWLDTNPSEQIIRQSRSFLNGGDRESGVSTCLPAAVLKTLDEDELDAEERVQRCQVDARQFLQAKPDMAWSRAQQAVTLLGRLGSLAAVTDPAARSAAHLTLAEVCFVLGLRNTRLASELGRPDLFLEASKAAISALRPGLAALIEVIGRIQRATPDNRLHALVELMHTLPRHKSDIEPWLRVEMEGRSRIWIEELEAALFNGHNAALLIHALPAFYDALDIPDRLVRTQRVQQRAVQLLIKDKLYRPALEALHKLTERQPKQEAICHEGLGDFRTAAECHLKAGDLKEALNCYRSIPDLDATLKLLGEIGEHPAAESLQWFSRVQQLIAERPDKFTKLTTPAEKKLLEDVLERALGVNRKKPAPKKAVKKKATAPRRAAPKKTRERLPF
ncbi:MAG: hypothetical protein WBW33_20415 [Bryobacteraceae bacterium]